MKKTLMVFTIISFFVFLSACTDETLVIPTIHPDAKPLLTELTVMASTVEAIGKTATAYAFTSTPSPTPIPPTAAMISPIK